MVAARVRDAGAAPDMSRGLAEVARDAPKAAGQKTVDDFPPWVLNALRERFVRALQELGSCRKQLGADRIAHDSSLSCRLVDHVDVLGAEVVAASTAVDAALAPATGGAASSTLAESLGERAPMLDQQEQQRLRQEQQEDQTQAQPQQQMQQHQQGQQQQQDQQQPQEQWQQQEQQLLQQQQQLVEQHLQEQQQRPPPHEQQLQEQQLRPPQQPPFLARETVSRSSASREPGARDVKESREKERLEEELSMAKALLMLSNVSLSMDLDLDDGADAPLHEVVRLKGGRRLLHMLIALKQKVSLLNRQCLLLRGDVLYLNHEMNVCRHWVMQSFRTAMLHHSQEQSSLQTRFERLSKVLN
eukprot:CAMPEP_0117539052 /NCGR_PEP_ID=MMETSP0784-20121206/42790_1 /TAXON_ID=39447 /ORGANISM="" /LENGTH=357 /DNA_ID=CAMNT_0005335675 /DNA_START=83 /DNA_END=1156 /DNA_ORIENTATION=-